MKLLRFAAIALLATIPMVACDDDTTTTVVPPTSVTIVGTVSGTVSVEGTGIAGVTVNLVGAASQSATTGAGGTYSFANVPAGTYGVQVSGGPADVAFGTTATVVTISTSGQTVNADFGGNYIRTSSIRGSVTSGSTGIVATVSLTGTSTASGTSNTSGDFEFTGLRAGDYTVTVSDFGSADITVTSRNVTVAVGQSANVTFVGTVEEVTTAATVTISTITASGTAGVTVIPTAVVGPIDVNLVINEGSSTLVSASVLLDGVVVGTQTFSTGAPEEGAEAAERNATIQINTAACGPAPGTLCGPGNGTPTYPATTPGTPNNRVVSAQVTTADGTTASASNSRSLTFANPDLLVGAVTAAGGTAVSAASQLWYGGALTVTITPVLYSGLTLGTVTTTYTDNAAAHAGHGGALTAAAAPWAVTFPSVAGAGTLLAHSSDPATPDGLTVTGAAYTNGTAFALGTVAAPRAFIGGVPAIAGAVAPVLTDLVAPVVTGVFNLTDQAVLAATVTCCANNWINSAYTFASGLTTTADLDGTAAFAGVGGIATTFHIGAATATAATVQATASAASAGAAGIATSLLNTDNQLWVGLTDALGNRSNTALAGAGSNALALTVGVEDNLPTTVAATAATIVDQTIIPGAAAGGAAHTLGFALGGVEDRAGFSAFPVQMWMTQDPATTNGAAAPYLIGASATAGGVVNQPAALAACAAAPLATVAAFNAAACVPEFPTAPDAYYKMGGALMDQAGNKVAEITRDWLIDQTAPTTSNVAIPPSLTGGAAATFSAAVADNVDLWTTAFAFDFGGLGSFIPFTNPVALGDGVRFDGVRSPGTISAVQAVNLVAQVEITTAGFAPPGAATSVLATNVTATTFDAAGNSSVGANNFIAGTVTAVAEYNTLVPALATFQVLAPAAGVFLCNGSGAVACTTVNPAGVTSVTLNAEATGPTGTMPNTFAGGTIYYYLVTGDGGGLAPYDEATEVWTLLGTTSGSSATFTDDGVVAPMLRHYNHTFTLSGSHAALAGAPAGVSQIAAIGVNTTGAALITQFNGNITVIAGT